MLRNIQSKILLLTVTAIASGCATVKPENQNLRPGVVVVENTHYFPQGASANSYSEVRVVTAAKIIKGNTFSILTAAPRILLGGGGQIYTEKTAAYGDPLEMPDKRTISNPLMSELILQIHFKSPSMASWQNRLTTGKKLTRRSCTSPPP